MQPFPTALLLLLLVTLGPAAAAEGQQRPRAVAASFSEMRVLSEELAAELRKAGDFSTAEKALQVLVGLRTLELGAEHPATLEARSMRVQVLCDADPAGTAAEAEGRALLPTVQRVLGAEDATTLACRLALAQARYLQDKTAGAEQECRSLHATAARVLGPQHETTLGARMALARLLKDQENLAEAEREYRQVLSHMPQEGKALEAMEETDLAARAGLAKVLLLRGAPIEAETLMLGVVHRRTRSFGPDHAHTLGSRYLLAAALQYGGRGAEAADELRSVIPEQTHLLGPEHPATLSSRASLAAELPLEERAQAFRTVLALDERVLGPLHPQTLHCCSMLAYTLMRQDLCDEAVPYMMRAYDGRLKKYGKDHPLTVQFENVVKYLVFNNSTVLIEPAIELDIPR